MPSPTTQMSVEQAGDIYDQMVALEVCTDLHGPDDPQTLAAAHNLAIAFWMAGEIDQALSVLDQVLAHLNSSFEPEYPLRIDVLSTFGEILFGQGHLELAGSIWREVLESRVRQSGANHPNSLEAKGDLATVLFELGEEEEAARLEQEAFETARVHLGKTHPVACVLAWNRALTHERFQDPDSARSIVVAELVWLLAEDPSTLGRAQNTIRSLVSKRLNWDSAKAC
jgi:tetratricopeptide (TPR) repeat protein